ncbi:hypothetical protein [Pseudokineococcus sp. 1T1Z-3]|uniref:hypothetical protein n=1 Tax=Pseudokineococcus sp. 1T1Z-3 TaxID=3132745 RepID=UPI0030A2D7D3
MAGGMTAGRGSGRGQPVARTAAGGALLGRPGTHVPAGTRVPSGPSAPPPQEVPAPPDEEAPPPAPAARGRPADPREDPPGGPAELRRTHRHCWVLPEEGDDAEEPLAGVVAQWRPTSAGWLARVVYALGDEETATVVESWLSADQLRPA